MRLNKLRILYIEDHQDTRDLVTFVLRERGFEIVTCRTMTEGLALAKTGSFNLYLLDSWLPDGSGIDLCRQIRQFDYTTPVVFYSAAAYSKDRQNAMHAGAQ